MLHLCPELKIYNSYIYILYRRRKLLMNYSTIATSGSSYLSAQSPPEEERLSWNTHESWQFTDSKEFVNFIAESTEVTFLMGVESKNMLEPGTDGPETS